MERRGKKEEKGIRNKKGQPRQPTMDPARAEERRAAVSLIKRTKGSHQSLYFAHMAAFWGGRKAGSTQAPPTTSYPMDKMVHLRLTLWRTGKYNFDNTHLLPFRFLRTPLVEMGRGRGGRNGKGRR